jgi:hypothetical protein
MTLPLSPSKLWSIALTLFLLDGLLLYAFFNRPATRIDTSWDFRIHELRQFDQQTLSPSASIDALIWPALPQSAARSMPLFDNDALHLPKQSTSSSQPVSSFSLSDRGQIL